jgi:PAS domain S-box-containing protein
LEDSTQTLYGLREMSDQLPDAVILTDKAGDIRTLNRAAERLFGREWNEIRNQPLAEIYEEPEEYKRFLEEVLSRHSVNEKVLTIRHPQGGIRYVSTSTTVLYDTHYNFQGVLSISRDVTAVKRLEQRYQRLRSWLIPSLISVLLLVIAILYGYPYFSTGHQMMDEFKSNLQRRIAEDQQLLKNLILEPFASKDRGAAIRLLGQFFREREKENLPYTGVVLLDAEKQVFAAYSIRSGTDMEKMIGSSYSGIDFVGDGNSDHKVLTLYRVDGDHPMGRKGIEIAFEIKEEDRFLGWLVFQMDTALLEERYHLDEEGLQRFRFETS